MLIVHRRLFESDEPRLFIGIVEDSNDTLARITGRTWFRSPLNDRPVQKAELRTKIISLASGTLLIYALPDELELESARFEYSNDGRLTLRVEPSFEMDVSESHLRRNEGRAA